MEEDKYNAKYVLALFSTLILNKIGEENKSMGFWVNKFIKTHKDGSHYIYLKIYECSNCNKSRFVGKSYKMCADCLNAHYCSVECQKAHWLKHKSMCKNEK